MIDADQKMFLQSFQASAMNTVAFQDDRSLIPATDPVCLQDFVGERKGTIDSWHPIVQHHIGMLPHAAQHLATRQRRTHRIAVGTRMRGEHETLVLFDVTQYVVQHVPRPFPRRFVCGCWLVSSIVAVTLRLGPLPPPHGRAGNTAPVRA